ncbi:Hypothetical protein NTJ_04853 [Nesidiocoris tenuis]|uniref:Uncharacterized protein n=1 Tax=Nesidiocoris tenuis TaxID=355587 RepID=A0ABN7AIF2_9HEMI|nr:Hypothetical protein NTJ_04853 [Nesidiocoris tenuis]
MTFNLFGTARNQLFAFEEQLETDSFIPFALSIHPAQIVSLIRRRAIRRSFFAPFDPSRLCLVSENFSLSFFFQNSKGVCFVEGVFARPGGTAHQISVRPIGAGTRYYLGTVILFSTTQRLQAFSKETTADADSWNNSEEVTSACDAFAR